VPFPHFYTDWCFGGFVIAVAAWVTLGRAQLVGLAAEAQEPLAPYRVMAALAAGVIFNVANALLVRESAPPHTIICMHLTTGVRRRML
jgi:hypothetical protein